MNIILDATATRAGYVQDAHCSFMATARCARDIVQATLDTVAALDSHVEPAAAHKPDDWSLITRGIVRGAIDFGANLEAVGEGIMLGAIRSAQPPDAIKTETIKVVAELGLHETIALGGDFEAMAAGLASGATQGGREVGNAETFINATAQGAFSGAQHSGPILHQLVEKAIRKTPIPTPRAGDPMAEGARE